MSTISGAELKRLLQQMDDYDFEQFVADLWSLQGWSTDVEQQSNDAGVDVRAHRSAPYEQKILIQAKRYGPNTTVGSRDVQQYAALKQQEPNVDAAVIVTTGSFSTQARRRAEELNVKLVDGDRLVALVDELDALGVVDSYVEVPRPEPAPDQSAASGSAPTGDSEQAATEADGSPSSFLPPSRGVLYGAAACFLVSLGTAIPALGVYLGFVFTSTGGFLGGAIAGWFRGGGPGPGAANGLVAALIGGVLSSVIGATVGTLLSAMVVSGSEAQAQAAGWVVFAVIGFVSGVGFSAAFGLVGGAIAGALND